MHIKVHIEANERGYAYGDEPNGEQNIDLEVSDEMASVLDISEMLYRAVKFAVRDYKTALASRPVDEAETLQ